MSFGFVDELEKDIVYGSTDECSQVEELSVDSVQGGFQEVALPWIFAVEQLQQLTNSG